MINAEKQYNPVDGATFYIDNIRYEYVSSPPYAWITSIDNATDLKDGIEVARFNTAIGEYIFNDTFKFIWTFVVPPTGELYYPQYSCDRIGVAAVNGKWESRIGLGNDNADEVGSFFDIVVMLADAQADQSLINTIKKMCADKKWGGLEKKELPKGLIDGQRIRVIRKNESFGPAPSIPNSGQLSGDISITDNDITDGAKVPPSRKIHGSFSSSMTSDIWILVYSTNGRWYPQSIDPCKEIHTIKAGDKWQGSASFTGKSRDAFDLVVVAATSDASKFLSDFQKSCCENDNNYPGLSTIQLPEGLTEKSRIRVYLE
jgi:hypothetical protein